MFIWYINYLEKRMLCRDIAKTNAVRKFGLFYAIGSGLLLASCNIGSSPSSQPAVPSMTSYSIDGVNGVISGNYIAVQLPKSTDVTDLVASYSVQNSNTVTVNGVRDRSGISRHDFTSPVSYTLEGGQKGETVVYTVAVNYGTLSTNMTSSTIYNCTTGFESATYVYLTGATSIIGQSVTLYSETEYNGGLSDHSEVVTVDAQGNAQMRALIPGPLLLFNKCNGSSIITFKYYGGVNGADYGYTGATVYPVVQQ